MKAEVLSYLQNIFSCSVSTHPPPSPNDSPLSLFFFKTIKINILLLHV